jgi:hypothetical protein
MLILAEQQSGSQALHNIASLEGEKGQSERSIDYLQKPRKLELS